MNSTRMSPRRPPPTCAACDAVPRCLSQVPQGAEGAGRGAGQDVRVGRQRGGRNHQDRGRQVHQAGERANYGRAERFVLMQHATCLPCPLQNGQLSNKRNLHSGFTDAMDAFLDCRRSIPARCEDKHTAGHRQRRCSADVASLHLLLLLKLFLASFGVQTREHFSTAHSSFVCTFLNSNK